MHSLKFDKPQKKEKSYFSRMKHTLMLAAITLSAYNCQGTNQPALQAPAQTVEIRGADMPKEKAERFEEVSLPSGAPLFDFGYSAIPVARERCSIFPEIEHWARRRGLDRHLVRAFVMAESDFDSGAAVKVCSRGAILSNATAGCFPADASGNSAGYAVGLDEMYDPSGALRFDIAPNSGSAGADWRWLSFGLMQTLEPPYTFWPASHHPDGVDGAYFDILARSGLRVPLDAARECNPNFNPFNAADSLCMGTGRMQGMLRHAQAWIDNHRQDLGWSSMDIPKDKIFAAYISGNMYSGLWESRARASDHPRCSSSMTNGDCWAFGFALSRSVDREYCGSSDGRQDNVRCENNHPKVGPDRSRPEDCYGMNDFVQYVRNCELPFLDRAVDQGAFKMRAFYSIRNSCP